MYWEVIAWDWCLKSQGFKSAFWHAWLGLVGTALVGQISRESEGFEASYQQVGQTCWDAALTTRTISDKKPSTVKWWEKGDGAILGTGAYRSGLKI